MSIVIIGFMGAGKTTVARELATKTQLEMVDTDDLLAQQFTQPTGQLLTQVGEPKFRELEFQTFQQALVDKQPIIATGGGIIESQASLELLQTLPSVYWLQVDYDVCWQRIANDQSRPIVAQSSYDELHARFERRQVLYQRAASYQLTASRATPSALATEIWTTETH